MNWPPQSPDLNAIEQLWDHLDRELRKNPETTPERTWKKLSELWQNIAPAVLESYVQSMGRRCKAVIDAHGGHTKYWCFRFN